MPKPAVSPLIALADRDLEIPSGLSNLESFRAWARSADFPERDGSTGSAGASKSRCHQKI